MVYLASITAILFPDGDSFWDFNAMELFATVSIVIAVLWGFRRWYYSRSRHTYDIRYAPPDGEFPPNFLKEIKWKKRDYFCAGYDDLSEVRIRGRAKRGVSVRGVSVQLVKRVWLPRKFIPYPLWDWNRVRISAEGVHVSDIYDAEHERQTGLWGQSSQPDSWREPDDSGGYRLWFKGQSLELLQGDSLWLRVLLDIRQEWSGHIEFQSASQDNKRAYMRRSIRLKPRPKTGFSTTPQPDHPKSTEEPE